MTWSYSGDPSASDRDEVRFRLGDTDTNRQLLSDEEIDFALTIHSSVQEAAAICCDAIVAKFSKEVDSATGAISRSGSQLAAQYRTLAADLRGSVFVAPRMGGFSQSEQENIAADSDNIPPAFEVGMWDYDGADDDE